MPHSRGPKTTKDDQSLCTPPKIPLECLKSSSLGFQRVQCACRAGQLREAVHRRSRQPTMGKRRTTIGRRMVHDTADYALVGRVRVQGRVRAARMEASALSSYVAASDRHEDPAPFLPRCWACGLDMFLQGIRHISIASSTSSLSYAGRSHTHSIATSGPLIAFMRDSAPRDET